MEKLNGTHSQIKEAWIAELVSKVNEIVEWIDGNEVEQYDLMRRVDVIYKWIDEREQAEKERE